MHHLICMHEPEGVQQPMASVDISDNAQVPVLQLICDTPDKAAVFTYLCIQFDYGLQR